jgi:hypothetical protein
VRISFRFPGNADSRPFGRCLRANFTGLRPLPGPGRLVDGEADDSGVVGELSPGGGEHRGVDRPDGVRSGAAL